MGALIEGTFTTVLKDSGFYGADLPVVGTHCGDCVSFAFARHTKAGDITVWAHAVITNSDTFERVEPPPA